VTKPTYNELTRLRVEAAEIKAKIDVLGLERQKLLDEQTSLELEEQELLHAKPTAIQVGARWLPFLMHCPPGSKFSVTQYFTDFTDGTYETVRSHVTLEEATSAFNHYTNNVACLMGITSRVIITDGGDCIILEWQNGKGIVWPNPENKEPPQ
jgi:hypothetical protein